MRSVLKSREKIVLRAFLKDIMLLEFLTDGGRWYQSRGAEKEKTRPLVRVRDLGTSHNMPLEKRRK